MSGLPNCVAEERLEINQSEEARIDALQDELENFRENACREIARMVAESGRLRERCNELEAVLVAAREMIAEIEGRAEK